MIDLVQWRASIGGWVTRCSSSTSRLSSPSSSFSTSDHGGGGTGVSYHRGSIAVVLVLVGLLLILSGDIETNPGPITAPTVEDMQEQLYNLTDWELFATHLPKIDQHDVSKISRDYHGVDRQKLQLYTVWLDKCTYASWDHVIDALEKNKLHRLVANIEEWLKTKRDKDLIKAKSNNELAPEGNGHQKVHSETESILQTETTASIKSTNNGHGQTNKLEGIHEDTLVSVATPTTAKELSDLFDELSDCLATEIEHVDVRKLRVRISKFFKYEEELDDLIEEHLSKIEHYAKPEAVLNYFIRNNFIGYINYSLIKVFQEIAKSPLLNESIEKYEKNYQCFMKSSLSQIHDAFQQCPDLRPDYPAGIPKFTIHLQSEWDGKSMFELKEFLKQCLNDRDCIDQLMIADISRKCIIITFAVLPHIARKVLGYLTNDDVIMPLKKEGISVDINELSLTMETTHISGAHAELQTRDPSYATSQELSHDKGRGKKRPPEPPGDHLAIVITNTYKGGRSLRPLPGVEIDREELYKTFNTARNFTLKFAEDCDEKGMRTLGRDISNELKREHRYQSVFIIFSGHGGKEGMNEALILWTNDGEIMYADHFIQKYKNYIIEGRHGDIPKYFLIDSCRGPRKLALKQIRAHQDKGGPGDIDDKCLIAYSTEDTYQAKCNKRNGSYWIVKVAKRLREVDEMHNEQSVIKAIEKSIDDVKKDPSLTHDQFPCIVKNTILSGGQVSDTPSVPRDVDPQCQVKGSLPVVHSDPAEYKELLKYLSSIPVATELHTFCSNLCLSPAKCQEIFKDPTIKGDFDAQRHRVLQLWRNTKKPTWGDFVEALDSTGFKDQAKEIADIKL